MRVGLLWQTENLGLYANASFDELYKGIGHNNGNLAFVYAIRHTIANPVKFFAWHTKPEVLKAQCDVIVIPCANQLGKHTDLGGMAKTLASAGLPVVAIGLGAQSEAIGNTIELTEGTRQWAEQIHAHRGGSGSNIYTRGPYTSQQLDLLGIEGSVVGGCPSHFINPAADLGAQIQARWDAHPLPRRISVAAGHQSWTKRTHIEHQLIALMQDELHPGQYVVQSMQDMIRISRGLFDEIDPKVLGHIHRYTVPHYSLDEFKTWCRRYATSFYDVPAWMDSLRRHDLAVGTRYHGVALAIQAGVMGLTVAIDSRTEELCSQTGVPFVRADALTGPLTRRTLREQHIKFDGARYDAFRQERAANYVAFLQANGLTPVPALEKLATAAPAAKKAAKAPAQPDATPAPEASPAAAAPVDASAATATAAPSETTSA